VGNAIECVDDTGFLPGVPRYPDRCAEQPLAAPRQRFSMDLSRVITSRLFHEEKGDDEHQSRQDDEDAPDAPEADHIRADGEVKPHH
jgi:hypothetical protein